MKLKQRISWLTGFIQQSLLPGLQKCSDTPITEQEEKLVSLLEIIEIEKHVTWSAATQWLGRKPVVRKPMARAFVAKSFYRFPTTADLIRALKSTPNLRLICGFETVYDIPSESTFSRAFCEFAKSDLAQKTHDHLVKEYLSGEIICHISRDSTAISAREKPKKRVKEPKKSRKRGRPAKGEIREPVEPKRLELQVDQTVKEALEDLPIGCDRGTKKNAKGYKVSWNGYKLHLDVNDFGFPVSAFVTSASLHDSQVGIPLMKMTSNKINYFYDLMDSAYDAALIRETSKALGHVPIIDKNSRGQDVIPFAPHEASRYKERSVAERANSRLKDDFGANNVRVRGHSKVSLHLMIGVVTLFADQLLKVLG